MLKKIDLRKDLRYLYQPSSSEVELVRVPKFNFLMIDGEGDPNSSKSFQDATQSLYAVAYTLKLMIKREKDVEYPVMPLEGLWWMDDMSQFSTGNRGAWKWKMMILQPLIVTKAFFKKAVKQILEKKEHPVIGNIRLETYFEGLSVQITHIGPFAQEGPTVQRLHAAARARGCELRGKHHEIYLGDPRKSRPEKLKTVIRQPIQKTTSTL